MRGEVYLTMEEAPAWEELPTQASGLTMLVPEDITKIQTEV